VPGVVAAPPSKLALRPARRWSRRLGIAALSLAAALALAPPSAAGTLRTRSSLAKPGTGADPWGLQAFLAPLSATAWLGSGLARNERLQLAPTLTLSALGRYLRPWENHTPEWRSFLNGRYGFEPSLTLTWRIESVPAPLELPVRVRRPCPPWQRPRPLTVFRYAGDSETMPLFDCDGAIAPDVIDRLSTLARAPDAPRPAFPLPEEAESERDGEWLPGLHLLDPRLVWVLGQIQQAFPRKAVVIVSGYRPDAHTSNHKHGKALDLYVQGVPNEQLFTLCRSLRDVGCGYYPHNHFVHIDVRRFGTTTVSWVDISEPGAPSEYVDGWPGVAEAGSVWLGR
jgi:hypothetical protein